MDKYIQDHVRDFKLSPYIHLRHSVKDASLAPDATQDTRYPWTVTVEPPSEGGGRGDTFTKKYSTLIVGNGICPTPKLLNLPGEQDWLKAGEGKRQIMHSMYYRSPQVAKGRYVVVVGNYPSGNHISGAICEAASEVCIPLFLSISRWLTSQVHHVFIHDNLSPVMVSPTAKNYTHHSARLVSLAANTLVLTDGSSIETPPDALIIEATGYWRNHPFLPPSVLQRVEGAAFTCDSTTLESNDRYIRPLYKCLMPLDPKIPYGSMAFTCLFPIVWNFPSGYAQGIWFAHLLADLDRNHGKSALLPDREASLKDIQALEKAQAEMGYDMAHKS